MGLMTSASARRATRLAALAVVLFAVAADSASGQTVWTGPMISFSKPAFADPSLAQNQDAILPGVVSLTRADERGLFNIATESAYTKLVSPADTEWAFSLNNPGETITATNFANLQFAAWELAHAESPPSVVGEPGVLHIVSADIYLDVQMTSWGVTPGEGGSFSYMRATPNSAAVPGPNGLLTLAAALAVALMMLGRARIRAAA